MVWVLLLFFAILFKQNQVGAKKVRFFPVVIGCKGDWPWLRKCFGLQTGFTSRRVCHVCPGVDAFLNMGFLARQLDCDGLPSLLLFLSPQLCAQEWWDLTERGQVRAFNGTSPDPFKKNNVSPFRSIPGANTNDAIKTDLMHAFNLGVGGDMAASTVLALVRMKVIFSGRSITARLDHAYEKFYAWCVRNGKSTSIPCFEPAKFKVTKKLVFAYFVYVRYFLHLSVLCGFTLNIMWPNMDISLRPGTYPKGCGKAFDTSLLCKWLEEELRLFDLGILVPLILIKIHSHPLGFCLGFVLFTMETNA